MTHWAHRAVHRAALILITVGAMLVMLAGCDSGSGPTPLRNLVTFTGTGDRTTVHFVTNGDWVLSWTCDPTMSGTRYAPFDLHISVVNGGTFAMVWRVVSTCETASSAGNVDVHESGVQWLIVGAGDQSAGWTLCVNVPQSDTGDGRVLPTLRTAVER